MTGIIWDILTHGATATVAAFATTAATGRLKMRDLAAARGQYRHALEYIAAGRARHLKAELLAIAVTQGLPEMITRELPDYIQWRADRIREEAREDEQ